MIVKTILRRPYTESVALTNSGLDPVLSRIYAARHVSNPAELDCSLKNLLPPTGLSGIDAAADLLVDAVHANARVVVVGDFDADGATSSALAVLALRAMGLNEVSYLVPNRFEFGYGLSPEIVEVAAAAHPDIIITVDNGIASFDGVDAAAAQGISVLITDHHLAAEHLPAADAIVNPNQPGDRFASKALAGVGVVFYVLSALRSRLRALGWFHEQGIAEPNMGDFLDLVALGTVADLVPLDHNNRILVAQGLSRINAGRCRPGIRALFDVAKRQTQHIVAADLGFTIGPRLNAAGRLDDMSVGIECLLADDEQEAYRLAQQLNELNLERRRLEGDMRRDAIAAVEQLQLKPADLPAGLCLYDSNWHQGIVGLVASRIREMTERPVVALAPGSDDQLKGSARSIDSVHIRDVLQNIATREPGLISKFGGHAMAAGLTLSARHLSRFEAAFADEVASWLNGMTLTPSIHSDGELESISLPLAEQLRQGGPWGQGFPEPIFDGEFAVIEQRMVGDAHLKLKLQDNRGNDPLDAIMFRYFDQPGATPAFTRVRAAYRVDINDYRGRRSPQLIIEYLEEC